jgi:hypothetical protein
MAVQPDAPGSTRRPDAPAHERWPDYFGVPQHEDGSHHTEPLLHLHRPPRTWAPVWRRSKLPSPPRAVTGLTTSERVVFIVLVPLVFAPIFMASRTNPIPIAICAVLTAAII